MILCVDVKALKTSPHVQRDVNLEDILNNHTKYYDSVEEAYKDHYEPLDFCVSIRSMYSNLVVQSKNAEGRYSYYTNLTDVQPFVHKGYDLIMYLTSIGLMHNVDYANGFDELMMKHSQFCPIGLLNPPFSYHNPIIYSHVIISDEGIKEFEKYLKSDRKLVNISDMNKYRGGIHALLDTLIKVEEVKIDEQYDNN